MNSEHHKLDTAQHVDERAAFEAALLATLENGVTVSLKRNKHDDYVAPYVARSYLLWKSAWQASRIYQVREKAAAPATERAQVQACRPEDRAMLSTPAGQALLDAAAKALIAETQHPSEPENKRVYPCGCSASPASVPDYCPVHGAAPAQHGGRGMTLRECMDAEDGGPAPPDGFVLVPVKPTDAMRCALMFFRQGSELDPDDVLTADELWGGVLAAAQPVEKKL